MTWGSQIFEINVAKKKNQSKQLSFTKPGFLLLFKEIIFDSVYFLISLLLSSFFLAGCLVLI
jgi:hypothetical protein